jgi:hypothetical protein
MIIPQEFLMNALRLFLVFGLLSLAVVVTGCDLKDDDNDDGPVVETTILWNLDSDTLASASQTLSIVTFTNSLEWQGEAAFNQTSGGMIIGVVDDVDNPGTALAAISVDLVDESATSAGTVYYRDAAGDFDNSLTATSADGRFLVGNVPAGSYLLRASAGGAGGLWVTVDADTVVVVTLSVDSGESTENLDGVVRLLDGSTAAPDAAVITVLGTGASDVVAGGAGAYGPVAVPERTTHRVTVSHPGHVNTTQTVTIAGAAVTAPDGDLVVATVAERDALVPAAITQSASNGIITGTVFDTAATPAAVAGVTVGAFDADGNEVGTAVYNDGSGDPDETVTVTAADGIYSILNVPPGTVYVRVISNGTAAGTVDVSAGELTIWNPSAMGAGTVTVSGSVQDSADTPAAIPGVIIELIGGTENTLCTPQGTFGDLVLPQNHSGHLRLTR